MKKCSLCGIEIKTKGYCLECRKVMSKNSYDKYRLKNIKKVEKICSKENCNLTFLSKGTRKYCIEHR